MEGMTSSGSAKDVLLLALDDRCERMELAEDLSPLRVCLDEPFDMTEFRVLLDVVDVGKGVCWSSSSEPRTLKGILTSASRSCSSLSIYSSSSA